MSTSIESTSRPWEHSIHIRLAEVDAAGWPKWRLRMFQVGIEIVRLAITLESEEQ